MTYATLLAEESPIQKFLVVMNPRKHVEGWTVVSGFIYKASFTFSHPTSVTVDGVTMTEVQTSSVGVSEWYFDETAQELYLRTPQSADPDSTITVVTFPIYAATFDAYWHADPLDDTTDILYYEPMVQKVPQVKITNSDALFGFLPVQSSSVTLINAEHWAERYVYDCSFNAASIKIYHALGSTLTINNIDLIYDGLMSDVSYDTETVTIKTLDRVDIFNTEYRNSDTSFFNTTDFANVDPNKIGAPIRYVYGYVKGFVPVNIDYVSTSPGTSDNRDWVVCGEQTGLSEVTRTVSASPSSTTTRTYISFAQGISVGDMVMLDGTTDYYVEVTAVNLTGDNYIEHAANAGAMASGDTVRKGFVSRIEIVQNGVKYKPKYIRDYTIGNFAVGTRGFSFTTSMEANLGMSTLTTNDTVSCTVYGRVNDIITTGLTSNDSEKNNLANPVIVIFDLLKRTAGLSDSQINLTDFAAARTATSTQGIGLAIPASSSGTFPTLKTLITDILKTSLIRFYLDEDLKWTVSVIGNSTTAIDEIDKTELLEKLSADYEYSDLYSDILVEYMNREVGDTIGQTNTNSTVTQENLRTKYLHLKNKTYTHRSLHFRSTDAQTLCDKISYIFGERKGTFSVRLRQKYYPANLNDTLTITSEKLPGFAYTEGTENSTDVVVIESVKDTRGIKLKLDDQKAIVDNTGSF